MYCSKCGAKILEGARYCYECGAPCKPKTKASKEIKEPEAAAAEQQESAPKKKRLLPALAIAGGVIIVLFAALLIIGSTQSLTSGYWYSEDNGTVLKFQKDDIVTSTSLMGTMTATYEFDHKSEQGELNIDGNIVEIYVEKGTLYIAQNQDATAFEKAGGGFNTEKFLQKYLTGFWSCKEAAEVLELMDTGLIAVHNDTNESAGEYEYDVFSGTGTIFFAGKEYPFTAASNQLTIENVGVYEKEAEDFDYIAFVEKYKNQLLGTWYDSAGVAGTYAFAEDGTVAAVYLGTESSGTYTFNRETNTVTVMIDGLSNDMSFSGDTLTWKSWEFTREQVQQLTEENMYEAVLGQWFDSMGMAGTIEFFSDGTAEINSMGMSQLVQFSFDPRQNAGTIGSIEFYLTNEGIMFSNYDYAFIRDYVEQYVSAIAGTWYEVSDDPGILVLDYDFSATYELYGSIYSGEYNFDEALNLGTLILGDAYYQIELSGELLMLIDNEGGAYYFSREEGDFYYEDSGGGGGGM